MLKTVGFPSTRTGDQTIIDGNLVIGTAGNGIDFSADPSAPGMTSKLLDDYEKGTWTPEIDSNVAGSGRSTTVRNARYTKIGNIVYVTCYVRMATLGTGGSGQIVIRGLPFAANSSTLYESTGAVQFYSLIAPLYSMSAEVFVSSTVIYLNAIAVASTSTGSPNFASYVQANTEFIVTCSYQTN